MPLIHALLYHILANSDDRHDHHVSTLTLLSDVYYFERDFESFLIFAFGLLQACFGVTLALLLLFLIITAPGERLYPFIRLCSRNF